MVLDFSQAPLVAINQTGMIEDIINTPLTALNHNAAKTPTTYTAAPPKFPAASYLFDITASSPALLPAQQAEFHSPSPKFSSLAIEHALMYLLSFRSSLRKSYLLLPKTGTSFVLYFSTSPLPNPIAYSYNALSRPKSSSTLPPHSVFTPTTSLIQECVPHSAEAYSTPNLLFKNSSRHPHVKPNL